MIPSRSGKVSSPRKYRSWVARYPIYLSSQLPHLNLFRNENEMDILGVLDLPLTKLNRPEYTSDHETDTSEP